MTDAPLDPAFPMLDGSAFPREEAWRLARDIASAPEGFMAFCRDAGEDPDVAFRTLVRVMLRVPRPVHRREFWPCAMPGCANHFAFSPDGRAESAVCCFCRDAEVVRRRYEAVS